VDRRAFLAAGVRAGAALSALALPLAAGAEVLVSERWRSLAGFLEREIPTRLARDPTTPGAAMALVGDAKVVWARGFGVTDRTTKASVHAGTVFEFGSISKTVFAYEVLKACERGLLDLDTPLTKYTTERYLEGDPRLDQITTRHILSHTGGFQNWRSATEPLKIEFNPGAGWGYSGEGYHYLQTVLTHLTGHVDATRCKVFGDGLRVCATDFDAFMKAQMFRPFQMTSSGYLYQRGMARPHDAKGQLIPGRETTAIEAARYGSAGQLHSTVNDYAKFLIEVLAPKPADRYRLGAASLREMLRPQIKITDTFSWGLGWTIHPRPDGDFISHSGDNPGFKTMTAASPSRRDACIIVTNGDQGFDTVISPLIKSEQMQAFLPIMF